MSDDLVKHLRNSKGWPTLGNAAADRIEELEAKLRKSALQELSALGQASEAYQAQLAAEAKLAQQDDLVQEAVAAALRKAADKAAYFANPALLFQAKRGDGSEKLRFTPEQVMSEIRGVARTVNKDILALITPDAQAALDRVVAEAKMDGAEIARQTVWNKLNGSQQAEQLCDAIAADIRKGGK